MTLKDKQAGIDLESLEMSIRFSMHKAGSIMLEKLLNVDKGYRGRTIPCDKGDKFEFVEYRDKTLLTVLGHVKVRRAYYYDKESKEGFCPRDKELDIEGTSFSPGVRRMIGRVGAYRPFGQGSEDIKVLAGIDINAKEIERISQQLGREAEGFCKMEAEIAVEADLSDKVIPLKSISMMYVCMDGTGVPVVKAETVNRVGKANTQAKTREAKLGCIFTQTKVDKDGRPQRDEDSTTYVGAIETAEEFGKRVYAEARRRAIESAKEVCVIGDGATWIWNIADEHFYGATQIVDLYHAREHYWNVAKVFFVNKEKKLNTWTENRKKELDAGDVEAVIGAIKRLNPQPNMKKSYAKERWVIFRRIKRGCGMMILEDEGCLLARGFWKQAAERLLDRGLNNPECTGRLKGQITLSHCVAVCSVTDGKTFGSQG